MKYILTLVLLPILQFLWVCTLTILLSFWLCIYVIVFGIWNLTLPAIEVYSYHSSGNQYSITWGTYAKIGTNRSIQYETPLHFIWGIPEYKYNDKIRS
jgi:hypothetical protein